MKNVFLELYDSPKTDFKVHQLLITKPQRHMSI